MKTTTIKIPKGWRRLNPNWKIKVGDMCRFKHLGIPSKIKFWYTAALFRGSYLREFKNLVVIRKISKKK